MISYRAFLQFCTTLRTKEQRFVSTDFSARKLVTGAALFIALVASISFSNKCTASTGAGKDIYQKRCSWCHGENGEGDGVAAAYANPAPRDLTSGAFKWKSTPFDEPMPADGDLRMIIAGHKPASEGWSGLKGTSMPGWADVLSDEEIDSIIDYMKELGGLDPPTLPAISLSGKEKPREAEKARAKELFKDRCSECHGTEGRGNGTKRLKDDWGGRTWPRDLTKPWTFRAGAGIDAIYTRITVGIPGTQMPSFADTRSSKALTEAERWAVADYVASLAKPDAMPVAGAVTKAARIDAVTPTRPDDPAWSKAIATALRLTPQIISDDRLFTPTNDSVVVKTLYNTNELSILLEWHDRTRSLPYDAASAKLSEGAAYPDGVAIQFPSAFDDESGQGLPPFGMGGKDADDAVEIWFWQAPAKAGKDASLRILKANGPQSIGTKKTGGVIVTGSYDNGVWQVVFKRTLRTKTDGVEFDGRRFIPFAVAAWDGSNGERGSRHTMTQWTWLSFTPLPDRGVFVWPVLVGALAFGILWLVFKSTVKQA